MKKVVLSYLVIAALVVSAAFTSCDNKDKEEEFDLDFDDDREVQLIETLTREKGHYFKWEYDSQGRITEFMEYENNKLSRTQTLTYSGDDLVKVTYSRFEENADYEDFVYEFSKPENNEIFISQHGDFVNYDYRIELNNNGCPVKIVLDDYNYSSYQYQGQNLISFTHRSTSLWWLEDYVRPTEFYKWEAAYDNMKSPILHCKTPKWFLVYEFYDFFGIHNHLNLFAVCNSINEVCETELGKWPSIPYEYNKGGYPVKGNGGTYRYKK